jgi:N-acetylglucosamine malate deacetylase 1
MSLRALMRRAYREMLPFVYARTNYKLFLQRTFEALDRRVLATICATNVLPAFVRPIPIKAPFGNRMLVVAPHQDDEIIGCGGAMLLQHQARRDVRVVFTQDGGDEHEADGRSRAEQVRIREDEALAVAAAMGIPAPNFLRFESLTGPELDSAVQALARLLDELRPDVICVPFILDYNRHHQLTNFALAGALEQTKLSGRVFCYEVWGLGVPNVILDISEVQGEKRRLLELYTSQLSGKDYAHGITGLNMFHSLHFGAGECRFAERFFEIPTTDYVRVVSSIRQSTSPNGSPLVF